VDVLYVVGKASSARNWGDLRWSLRSLASRGRNLGRVIVAGFPPPWLRNAEPVHIGDLPGRGKHANILNCILRCADAGIVRGEFLYSSDDHYLLAPRDLDRWPFVRRPLEWGPMRGGNDWKRSVEATRALLEANGYPTVRFDMHRNTRLDTYDAAEVRRLSESAFNQFGYEPTDLFTNVRLKREPGLPVRIGSDHKGGGSPAETVSTFAASVAGRSEFSTSDAAARIPGFAAWMDALYPDKSPYER